MKSKKDLLLHKFKELKSIDLKEKKWLKNHTRNLIEVDEAVEVAAVKEEEEVMMVVHPPAEEVKEMIIVKSKRLRVKREKKVNEDKASAKEDEEEIIDHKLPNLMKEIIEKEEVDMVVVIDKTSGMMKREPPIKVLEQDNIEVGEEAFVIWTQNLGNTNIKMHNVKNSRK